MYENLELRKRRGRVLKEFLKKSGNFLIILALAVFQLSAVTVSVNQGSDISYQGIRITGIVTDASTGEALPGVNIVVEGTTIGAITGADGSYSVEITSPNPAIVFSFIGYLPQRITVGNQRVINIRLAVDVATLDEGISAIII